MLWLPVSILSILFNVSYARCVAWILVPVPQHLQVIGVQRDPEAVARDNERTPVLVGGVASKAGVRPRFREHVPGPGKLMSRVHSKMALHPSNLVPKVIG